MARRLVSLGGRLLAHEVKGHPLEFLALQEVGGRLAKGCISLFDTYFQLAEKGSNTARRQQLWPFLMKCVVKIPDFPNFYV